jgi:SH3-like domain-containing protein
MKVRRQTPPHLMTRRIPLLSVIFALSVLAGPALAQTPAGEGITRTIGPSTSLPIPRFVTLKRDKVYMRRGPGEDHQIEWVYKRKHMPMEVLNEYEQWRKVRDVDGTEGWISATMLSGERYVLLRKRTSGAKRWTIRNKPKADGHTVALVDPGVLAELKRCPGTWCEIKAGKYSGWVTRSALWGILPGETVE